MYWHLEFQFFLFFSLRLFSSALNMCLSLTFDVADNYLLERWQSSSRSVLLARYRTYLQVFTFAVAMKYSACDTVRIYFCFFSFFNLISLLFSSSSSSSYWYIIDWVLERMDIYHQEGALLKKNRILTFCNEMFGSKKGD